jgi:hypothetical protein
MELWPIENVKLGREGGPRRRHPQKKGVPPEGSTPTDTDLSE